MNKFNPGTPNRLRDLSWRAPTINCLTNGEASLALKQAQGTTITSLFGYTLVLQLAGQRQEPDRGLPGRAAPGSGRRRRFTERYVRTTGDIRYYRPIYDQIIGLVHLQAGDIRSFGGSDLRIVDNFNLGPTLVRGFAPDGIGPRDTSFGIDYARATRSAAPNTGAPRWKASSRSTACRAISA